MKHAMLIWAAGLLVVACGAGGAGLDGTYSDQLGVTTYKFASGGKVFVSVMGTETELTYAIDGDKIKIAAPQGGNLILTRLDDGSLSGPMGVKLTKASAAPKTGTRPARSGANLNGSYTDARGTTTYRFTSGGSVSLDVLGVTTALRYEVDGDTAKVFNAAGDYMLLTLREDGSFSGPAVLYFCGHSADPVELNSTVCAGVKATTDERFTKVTTTAGTTTEPVETKAATPAPAAPAVQENDILASMKGDLRNLVTAQEFWKREHGKYTANLGDTFMATPGNSLPQITLVGSGWTATISNANTPQVCVIFVGSTPIPPATQQARPECQ